MVSDRSPEDDLEWYWRQAAADVGMHAAGLEPGSAAVFDDAASRRLHLAHRDERHRAAVRRLTRVGASLAALSPADVRTLRLGFEARGFAFTSPFAEVQVLGACRRARSNVVLLALLLDDEALEKRRTPDDRDRLALVERVVRASGGRDERLLPWFLTLRAAVNARLTAAIDAFRVVRDAHLEWEEEERTTRRRRHLEDLARTLKVAS